MSPADTSSLEEPIPEGMARVFFIAESSSIADEHAWVFEGTTLLGTLKTNTYFTADVPGGHHHFLIVFGPARFVSGEIEPGATYYIEVSFGAGPAEATPVPAEEESNRAVLEKISAMTFTDLNPGAAAYWESRYTDLNLSRERSYSQGDVKEFTFDSEHAWYPGGRPAEPAIEEEPPLRLLVIGQGMNLSEEEHSEEDPNEIVIQALQQGALDIPGGRGIEVVSAQELARVFAENEEILAAASPTECAKACQELLAEKTGADLLLHVSGAPHAEPGTLIMQYRDVASGKILHSTLETISLTENAEELRATASRLGSQLLETAITLPEGVEIDSDGVTFSTKREESVYSENGELLSEETVTDEVDIDLEDGEIAAGHSEESVVYHEDGKTITKTEAGITASGEGVGVGVSGEETEVGEVFQPFNDVIGIQISGIGMGFFGDDFSGGMGGAGLAYAVVFGGGEPKQFSYAGEVRVAGDIFFPEVFGSVHVDLGILGFNYAGEIRGDEPGQPKEDVKQTIFGMALGGSLGGTIAEGGGGFSGGPFLDIFFITHKPYVERHIVWSITALYLPLVVDGDVVGHMVMGALGVMIEIL